eukprot:TRINITY_DN3445_c0_g3_i1.p1 TRINITY_DN3445_c0_g3~~TRINITY_DN3445_c0_g3_i1.p1  ORF type:complete len:246 (+),score=68.69 TRINITY_DN3445_c0_g3_i1:514-1251(+)
MLELQTLQIKELNNNISELKKGNEKLQATVSDLRNNVGDLISEKALLEDKVDKLAARNKELVAENNGLKEKLKDYNTTMDSRKIVSYSSTIQKYVLYKYVEEDETPTSGNLDDAQMHWLKYSILSSATKTTVDMISVSSGDPEDESGSRLIILGEKDGVSKFGKYTPGETEMNQKGFTFSLSASAKCLIAEPSSPARSDFWEISGKVRPEEASSCIYDKLKEIHANPGKGMATSLQVFKVKLNNY